MPLDIEPVDMFGKEMATIQRSRPKVRIVQNGTNKSNGQRLN